MAEKDKINGTFVHGIGASQALDSSGERIIIEGIDASSLTKDGTLTWEHNNKEPSTVIGKIVEAKKIINKSDCENDNHRYFWDKVKMPYLYIAAELFDGVGHQAAKDVAAMLRYDGQNTNEDSKKLINFSIEGSRLEKIGDNITKCIARRITVTVTPCNKTAFAEELKKEKPNTEKSADSGFEPREETFNFIQDLLIGKGEKESSCQLMKSGTWGEFGSYKPKRTFRPNNVPEKLKAGDRISYKYRLRPVTGPELYGKPESKEPKWKENKSKKKSKKPMKKTTWGSFSGYKPKRTFAPETAPEKLKVGDRISYEDKPKPLTGPDIYGKPTPSKPSWKKSEEDVKTPNKKDKKEQLTVGIKVEKEHADTLKKLISDAKKGKIKPLKHYITGIAKDHIKEIEDYYTRLINMENKAKKQVKKSEIDKTKDIKSSITSGKKRKEAAMAAIKEADKQLKNKEIDEHEHKLRIKPHVEVFRKSDKKVEKQERVEDIKIDLKKKRRKPSKTRRQASEREIMSSDGYKKVSRVPAVGYKEAYIDTQRSYSTRKKKVTPRKKSILPKRRKRENLYASNFRKALTASAGLGGASPSTKIQGNALQKNITKSEKNQILRDLANESFNRFPKKEELIKFLSDKLPNIKDKEILALAKTISYTMEKKNELKLQKLMKADIYDFKTKQKIASHGEINPSNKSTSPAHESPYKGAQREVDENIQSKINQQKEAMAHNFYLKQMAEKTPPVINEPTLDFTQRKEKDARKELHPDYFKGDPILHSLWQATSGEVGNPSGKKITSKYIDQFLSNLGVNDKTKKIVINTLTKEKNKKYQTLRALAHKEDYQGVYALMQGMRKLKEHGYDIDSHLQPKKSTPTQISKQPTSVKRPKIDEGTQIRNKIIDGARKLIDPNNSWTERSPSYQGKEGSMMSVAPSMVSPFHNKQKALPGKEKEYNKLKQQFRQVRLDQLHKKINNFLQESYEALEPHLKGSEFDTTIASFLEGNIQYKPLTRLKTQLTPKEKKYLLRNYDKFIA